VQNKKGKTDHETSTQPGRRGRAIILIYELNEIMPKILAMGKKPIKNVARRPSSSTCQ
jgi:hypothetical protein